MHYYLTPSIVCDSSCNEGLMRCSGPGANECCGYYNNSLCVNECPPPFAPDANYECVCPTGSSGLNCADGIIVNEPY